MLSTRLTMRAFYSLFNDLREDDGKFFNYFWMSPRSFDELYSKFEDHLYKMDTNMRRCIHAKEKLAVTLRYVDYRSYVIFMCLSVMPFRPFSMDLRSESHNMNKYSPIMSAKSIKEEEIPYVPCHSHFFQTLLGEVKRWNAQYAQTYTNYGWKNTIPLKIHCIIFMFLFEFAKMLHGYH
jgi:hypothetical protein